MTIQGASEPEPRAEATATLRKRGWRSIVRMIAGVGAIVILGFILIFTLSADADANAKNASAVQLTQIYAESIFYAVIFLGICVGLYVMSRSGE